MKPYYQDDLVTIFHADCRDVIPLLPNQCVSAIVCDPPYGLGFMGKGWDKQGVSFQPGIWRLIRKACLPGAPLLSFGGTRTSHRIACAIEDAGWQIRDTIMWVYGSGFPKSLDISKAIDRQAGAKREVVGQSLNWRPSKTHGGAGFDKLGDGEATINITTPATPEAKLWEGYGTALKPAYEPIILAMKPIDGTFANNALKHKVAGLNIDACRIPTDKPIASYHSTNGGEIGFVKSGHKNYQGGDAGQYTQIKGRFPSNLILDGSQEVMELFPNTKSGNLNAGHKQGAGMFGKVGGDEILRDYGGDSGSAARFFCTAKASKRERNMGCEDLIPNPNTVKYGIERLNTPNKQNNSHPTVKPLALMTYLCSLVKMPEYNLIFDPFCGSGTTLLACKKLGIPCIGIDSSEEYCEISAKRVYSFNG